MPNRCEALPVPRLRASLGASDYRSVTGNRLAVSCAVFSSASPSFGIAGDTEPERVAGAAPSGAHCLTAIAASRGRSSSNGTNRYNKPHLAVLPLVDSLGEPELARFAGKTPPSHTPKILVIVQLRAARKHPDLDRKPKMSPSSSSIDPTKQRARNYQRSDLINVCNRSVAS